MMEDSTVQVEEIFSVETTENRVLLVKGPTEPEFERRDVLCEIENREVGSEDLLCQNFDILSCKFDEIDQVTIRNDASNENVNREGDNNENIISNITEESFSDDDMLDNKSQVKAGWLPISYHENEHNSVEPSSPSDSELYQNIDEITLSSTNDDSDVSLYDKCEGDINFNNELPPSEPVPVALNNFDLFRSPSKKETPHSSSIGYVDEDFEWDFSTSPVVFEKCKYNTQVSCPPSISVESPTKCRHERKLGVCSATSCGIPEKEDTQSEQKHACPSTHPCQQTPQTHVSAPCSPSPAHVEVRLRKQNLCVRRRVSFPEDRRLITSYLEPADPWECMDTTLDTEAILQAYCASCVAHHCDPLPIVVRQIKALPLEIPGRVDCFSLKATKLTHVQCEVLEELFKRVQFVRIDLESCGLTDETFIPLLDMIEFYDSATELNVSFNSTIGTRGWQVCNRVLRKNHSLHYLDAHNTNMDEHVNPFSKALGIGSKLHTLHLENCNLTGRPLISLTAALRMDDTLVKLYLADNRMGSADSIHLQNLVKANLTLKLLDLRNNNLQDSGCALVCEGVAEQYKTPQLYGKLFNRKCSKVGLNALILWNNHLTVSASKHLAAMINSTLSLETLNIGRNGLANDGIIRLKDALMLNKTIKRLYLHANKITNEGAVAIAEYIAESTIIERVDLRDNIIGVAGLLALNHSLKLNKSVIQMDLDSNHAREPDQEMSNKHKSLLIEIKEFVRRNQIDVNMDDSSSSSDSEDYYRFDPDFRKLSIGSDIYSNRPKANEEVEIKKYRSPSPSPCASPIPSPAPSPLRSRFRVHKVTHHDCPITPIGSPIFSSVPLLGISNNNICSSAPSSSTLSTTSRPVVQEPKLPGRNRFLSGTLRKFTVTRVSENLLSSSLMSTKSVSLPVISQDQSLPRCEHVLETQSPQIVISSPIKIERGFSLDENKDRVVNVKNGSFSSIDACNSSSSLTSLEETDNLTKRTRKPSDSSSNDDVFISAPNSGSQIFTPDEKTSEISSKLPISPLHDHQMSPEITKSPVNEHQMSSETTGCPLGRQISSDSTRSFCQAKHLKDLTDSGFLEDPSGDSESGLYVKTGRISFYDGDRDSLCSLSSDHDTARSHDMGDTLCADRHGDMETDVSSMETLAFSMETHVPGSRAIPAMKAPLATFEATNSDSDSEVTSPAY